MDKKLIGRELNGGDNQITQKEIAAIGKEVADSVKIESVAIPDSVKENGKSAFENCSSLDINENAFDDISMLENSQKELHIVDNELLEYKGDKPHVKIPENVTRIGICAFYNNKSLESVIIPDSVYKIDSDAFRGCTKLEKVKISKNVVSVGTNAFENTPWLTKQTGDFVIIGKALYKYKGKSVNIIIHEYHPCISNRSLILSH